MVEMKIGLQLFTLRNHLNTEDEIKHTLGYLKKIGYDGVQPYSLGNHSAEQYAKMLQEAGLPCFSFHVGLHDIVEKFSETVEKMRIMDCSSVVLACPPAEVSTAEKYREMAALLQEYGLKHRQQGIQVGYHNHEREMEQSNGMTFLESVLHWTTAEALHAQFDTFWVQYGGGDPAEWILKYPGRQKLIHLKDMTIRDRKIVFAEVGEGNLNWKRIIESCKTVGIEWLIVEQDVCELSPLDSVRISYENIRRMLETD